MNTLALIRQWLLAILWLGVIGAGVELILLEHYETAAQWTPLASLALAIVVLIWHRVRADAPSIRALQATMMLFVAAGAVGAVLHYRGAAAFQLEIDPSQGRWEIFKKAMRSKAPPVLAPGLMLQLGLIGLAYAYRHPVLDASDHRPTSSSRQ
jgi:hypothetical protein